jgi:hypothetical protein
MLTKTYAALKAAGVSEEQAQDASGALRSVEEECSRLRSDFSQIHADIANICRRIDVLIWLVGINAAATIAILVVLLGR